MLELVIGSPIMPTEAITRRQVDSALREICVDRTGSGRDSDRRAYLLSVLGWMTRNLRDSFTEADAAANRATSAARARLAPARK